MTRLRPSDYDVASNAGFRVYARNDKLPPSLLLSPAFPAPLRETALIAFMGTELIPRIQISSAPEACHAKGVTTSAFQKHRFYRNGSFFRILIGNFALLCVLCGNKHRFYRNCSLPGLQVFYCAPRPAPSALKTGCFSSRFYSIPVRNLLLFAVTSAIGPGDPGGRVK